MRHLILTAIFCVFFHLFGISQQLVEVTYEQDSRGYFNFICMNNDYCNNVLSIDFSGSLNLKSYVTLPYKGVVKPGRNMLFALRPENPSNPITLRFTYRYIKGCINPEVKPDFVYLLPVGKGKQTEPIEMKYFKINPKDPDPKDWYSVGFKMKYGDTVYAARRGVVCDMRDTTKLQTAGYTYSSDDNYIQIYHGDCSFGRYDIFSKILVNLGQTVEAGEPIGLAGGDKYTTGSHVRLCVFYNFESGTDTKTKDATTRKQYWAYIPLQFYTNESPSTRVIAGKIYTAGYPDNLITQEMTSGQIKRWEKNKAKANKK